MNKKSFTLIELLVVIAIIGILSSLVIARFSNWNDEAKIANTLQWSAGVHRKLGANLVGNWPLDEIVEVNKVVDISGYGNYGTVYGDPVSVDGVNGPGSYALDFDGNDDYIEIKNPLTSDGLYTTTSWFKLDTLKPTATLIEGIGMGMHLAWGGSGGIQKMLLYYGNELYVYSKNNNHFDNKWHHVSFVVRYDDDNYLNSDLKIFIDGVDETHYRVFSTDRNGFFRNSLRIAYTVSSGGYINGALSDVRIYDTALTAEEVSRIYAESKDGYLAEE